MRTDYQKIKVAIFASGNGSNAENIVRYFSEHEDVEIDSIFTNKENAFVINRAKKLNTPCFYYSNPVFSTGDQLLKNLINREIDFIVLAGFLIKIPLIIIEVFPNKILNIHPALLPKYGGKGMYGSKVHEAVKDANDTETGITIHFVNKNYDEGATVFQANCRVEPSDSADDIAQKVHLLEYEHFPVIIEKTIASIFT